MYMYDGLNDPTRVTQKAITMKEIESLVKRITAERDDARGGGQVVAFDYTHLPPEVNCP